MKEQNYEVIRECIMENIGEYGYRLAEKIGVENACQAIMNIYLSNDTCKGFGQDYRLQMEPVFDDEVTECSVISSLDRVSIIADRKMSYYKADLPLCGYEDLNTDIVNIGMIIDTVFERIDSQ